MFEQLEHKADLKYKVIAKDMDALFKDITSAVDSAIFEKSLRFYDSTKELTVVGKTTELLIHNYIEELLYTAFYDYKQFILLDLKFENNLNEKKIIAKLGLKRTERKDYNVEVKACSYSIQLEKKKDFYECVFVLDI